MSPNAAGTMKRSLSITRDNGTSNAKSAILLLMLDVPNVVPEMGENNLILTIPAAVNLDKLLDTLIPQEVSRYLTVAVGIVVNCDQVAAQVAVAPENAPSVYDPPKSPLNTTPAVPLASAPKLTCLSVMLQPTDFV